MYCNSEMQMQTLKVKSSNRHDAVSTDKFKNAEAGFKSAEIVLKIAAEITLSRLKNSHIH